jgi:ABC-type bacteriocin/lantibiotic exporter with double-glycine peptidase domain
MPSQPRAAGPRRRFFAPEVIQTSAMDCGPAALKCLLEGFGVPVSYGRLREACQTSVDGTSIDTLESLARTIGLDAEQIMMPADHLLLPEAEALPAIVVVRQPTGLTHFVVVWRAHGPWVQVMDPGRGRRWVRREAFLRDVYVHTMKVPAEAFRQWAGSDGFLAPLRRRLGALGLPDGGEGLVAAALADPTWRGPAALDAATRTVGALLASRALPSGHEAARLCETLAAEAVAAQGDAPLPARFTTASAAPVAEDGSAQVSMRGAVLVRVAGVTRLDEAQRADLPRELRAAVDEPRARPGEALLALLRQDGLLRWGALAAGLALAAGGAVFEAAIFRGLFDAAAGRGAGLVARIAAHMGWGWGGPSSSSAAAARGVAGTAGLTAVFVVALAAVAAFLALEWPVAVALRGAGRRLEQRLRHAFLRKIPRLGDRYFQSRTVSDMAERAHLAHRLRALPGLGGQLVRAALELVVTAGALAWLYPAGAPLALGLAAAMLLVPFAAQPALAERDLRMRNHAGALARFSLDALLGLTAIRTHRAESALAREHGERLDEWLAAARAALRAALTAESLQTVIGFGLAAALLVRFVRSDAAAAGDPGAVLLVVYWSLTLPTLGQEIAGLVQQVPSQRNITLRLVEPLGAPEDGPVGARPVGAPGTRNDGTLGGGTERGPTQPRAGGLAQAPARLELRDVVLQAGGHTILTVDALAIAAGEHVAIVGPSGAGKSSLVGLLLGWHRAATGAVHVDGAPLEGDALEALRRRTVWVDPTVYLWNRSLHDNLAYGLGAAPVSLEAAIAEADLGEVVSRLPRGAESALGEAGALLSGGEGQRVRFGRGVVRERPRLVILDEPFRGLTRDQRRVLLGRARARWAHATLLCVTHDIDETRAFPRVVVVADGRVVEDAPPAELVAREGSRYAALVEADTRVRRAAWSSAATVKWRRLTMQGGRLVDTRETNA